MKYSYTKARKKTPFTPEVQLVVLFFGISFLMLFITYLFLLFKDYSFTKEKKELLSKQEKLISDIYAMEDKINYIHKQEAMAQKIHTQNMVLKDSITNLFDLVPQRITLSRAELLKNGLILYGITPNKDVYNFMLQAPLRSIFQKTYTSFYPAKNGWLMFVSKNYTADEDEELESED
jgi:hypothetical protein